MSANRCFGSSNKSNSTSSDYTIANKQKTIFTGIVNQVNSPTKFVKSNGQSYNKNFGINNCNELTSSKSYDLLLDVTKGRRIANPLLPTSNGATIGTSSNEAWSGNLYSINYNNKGINNVVDTSYNAGNDNTIIFPMTQTAIDADSSWNGLYPGVMIDPTYQLFYDACSLRNNNGNGNVWRNNLVDMSLSNIDFTQNNYYKQHTLNSQKLYGMNFPEKVKFDTYCCPEKIVNGGLFSTQTELNTLRGCTKIIGDINIINFTTEIDFSVFNCLKEITGVLSIDSNAGLKTISGFTALKTVVRSVVITNNAGLKTISGFTALEKVFRNFVIIGNITLNTISGFPLLNAVSNFQIQNNSALKSISGFTSLNIIAEDLLITDNGSSNTPDFENVVTTITGFGSFTLIINDTIVNGISGTKLLKFDPDTIKTNITTKTIGTQTFNNTIP